MSTNYGWYIPRHWQRQQLSWGLNKPAKSFKDPKVSNWGTPSKYVADFQISKISITAFFTLFLQFFAKCCTSSANNFCTVCGCAQFCTGYAELWSNSHILAGWVSLGRVNSKILVNKEGTGWPPFLFVEYIRDGILLITISLSLALTNMQVIWNCTWMFHNSTQFLQNMQFHVLLCLMLQVAHPVKAWIDWWNVTTWNHLSTETVLNFL